MEIIPAIYILDGHCVALYKGSYQQKATYVKSPIQMAKFFEHEGAEKIHVVDLNTRKDPPLLQEELLGLLTKAIHIPVQLEATLRSMQEIDKAFQLGVSAIVLRPLAFDLIQKAIQKYGPEKILVEIQSKGPDVVPKESLKPGEGLQDVVDFAESLVPLGVKNVIYKDERSEGTMIHPNYDEVDRLVLVTGQNLKIYVSGGVGEIKHLLLLKKIGTTGAIIGKALYERQLSLPESKVAVQ